MSFDKMLEKLRRKKGLQVQALARLTGISQAKLKLYERGTEKPTLTEVCALCYVLTTTPEELEYWENGTSTNAEMTQQAQNGPQGWDSAVQWSEPPKNEANSKKKEAGKKKTGEHATTQATQPKSENPAQEAQVAPQTEKAAKQQTPQAEANAETVKKEDTSSQTATAKAEKEPSKPAVQQEKKTQKTATTTTPRKPTTFKTTAGQDISTIDDPDGSLAVKMKNFGQTLKHIREQKNIRYSTIQEELGIAIVDYVRIEKGRLVPTRDLFNKILKLFDIPTQQ